MKTDKDILRLDLKKELSEYSRLFPAIKAAEQRGFGLRLVNRKIIQAEVLTDGNNILFIYA